MPEQATIQRGTPQPVSRTFGFDRGTPIDRYYIERFLDQNKTDIAGRVMEVGSAAYTRRFGAERVTRADVLHATQGNRHATIVGDLATGDGIPQDEFHCIVLTQVLPFVFDVAGAVRTIWHALRAGGIVLATVPGISQISRYDMDRWGDFWRFTDLSARRLFEQSFGPGNVTIATAGNVAVATRFLQGVALEEVPAEDLDPVDSDYQVMITIRARKGGTK